MKRFLFFLALLASLAASSQTVVYPSQTGSYNVTRTINTNGSYFAGTYNNGGSELGLYANGNGGTYIGDPGAAIFHTFTTDGSASGTSRPMKVGDQFQITCYVGTSGNFFNNSSAGISFNGGMAYSAFSNYNTLQRAKFQINQNGAWFPATGAAGNGYANAGQDVTFTLKLTSAKTANLTISSANGGATYDMVLANSPGTAGDNIMSFALWNQTSGNGNDMYWKNGSLTSTGTIEIGNGNASSTFDGTISDGLLANSSSTVKVNTLTKAGTGTVTLTAANTYTGATTVNSGILAIQNTMESGSYILNGGTLRTDASNILSDTATITLAGGTLSTGSGFNDAVGTLSLSASSTLALGSNSHALTFANSSGITWNGSATLNITGWSGTAGESNATHGRIMVGVGGLTLAQRQKITFAGYPGTPIILAGGELVPAAFYTITASSGSNGSIIPVGATTLENGSDITYTISPDACYAIADVLVDGSSVGAVSSYTFTNLAANHTINAVFSENTYSIIATAGANGAVTPNGANSVNCGDNATFTITPDACYSIADVLVDGVSQGAVGVYTFTNVSAGHSISATFTLNTYSITATTGANGSISPFGSISVNCGANQTFTIIPDACAVVQDVVVDGISQGAIGTYTFTNVTSAHTISASFIATFVTFYADSDGDGYGNPLAVVSACSAPQGYVADNTDCNDNNAAIYRNGTFFVDADNDGYNNGGGSATVCYGLTTPSGYTMNTAIDCNDAVAAINPGHAEVLYNGVDDNCNGQLDEGNQLKTKLLPESCGATLASINSLIGITTVSSQITGYRIRVTNGASVQIIEKNVPHFTLPELPTYAYATTYTVEIELQRLGVWLGYYGDPCLVSSPPVLTQGGATQVSPSQCGGTLAQINTLIATTSLAGVTGYRFRVTNLTTPTGPNVVQIIDRAQHWFSLQMLAQYNYATTYQIEIAIKTTGTYGGYGGVCNITSPAAPSLTPCGGTIAASTTRVSCSSLNGVTQYRFQIIRDSDGATTTIDRNTNYFTFAQIPGYTPNALYNVRVAVMTTGIWSPFGDACQITSPPSVARHIAQPEASSADAPFSAVAYPNPFVEDIEIQITSESGKKAEVSIYDLTGRQIEKLEVLGQARIGGKYPAGVYTVIVIQGTNSKVQRIIKR